MTDFMVKVMLAVFKALLNDKDFTAWVDARLAGIEDNIKGDIENVEANLIREVQGLPAKIVGDAESDVKGLLGPLPGQVKDEMNPLFQGLQAIIGRLQIPGLPNIFGIGK